ALGMFRSALVAAAANLAAAVAALRLWRAGQEAAEGERTAPARGSTPAAAACAGDAPPLTEGRLAVLMVALAASGAGALILEVVWTRILSLVLGSSTQAFSIMLTTFLAGLALGSALATRRLASIRAPLTAFALVEIGVGLAAWLGVHLFPELPYSFLDLYRRTGGPTWLFHAGRFALAALVMLPPTILLGAAFPLAARAALIGGRPVASRVGALYAANTVGAIAGAVAAGFRFIPSAGLQGTLLIGCLINLAAAAMLLAFGTAARPALRFSMAGALAAVVPFLLAGAPAWNATAMTSGVYQYAPRYLEQFTSRSRFRDFYRKQPLLYYRDGPTTTVSVERRPERYEGRPNLVLTVNGKVDASSTGDMDTQVLAGQLPMLAHPAPRSVFLIGLASGVSAGSVLTHPIEHLTIAEIEPSMIEAQTFFEEINGRPLADPRTTLRIDDARNELLVSPARYDVIISEPSNPWLAGPSKLFTREFFELARSRLQPGGILCQWVQLYGMDPDALKAVLRTYAEVFPSRLVFKGSPGDLLVLGSDGPLRFDVPSLQERMRRPEVAADLARVKVHDVVDLLARFRLGTGGVDRYVGSGPGPVNTDDNGFVEFAAARSLYREDHQANDAELAAVADALAAQAAWGAESAGGGAVQTLSALASRLVRMGLLDRAERLLGEVEARPALDPAGRAALLAARGELLQKRGRAVEAGRAWSEALAHASSEPRAALGLAGLRLASGDHAGAAAVLAPAAADPSCAVELARALLMGGDLDGAGRALEDVEPERGCSGTEAGHDPRVSPLLHLQRGRLLAARGDSAGAVRNLKLYFDLFPRAARTTETSLEAASALAHAHLALGQKDEALAQFRSAVALADSLASFNRGQAEQLIRRRELEGAASHLRAALRWNRQDNGSRRLLGYALNDLGRHQEAVATWRDLDRALDGDIESLRNIAGLCLQLGRPSEALEAFRKWRGLEPDPGQIEAIDRSIAELEAPAGG
ncbi:MAG TPA: fused MFS/spermidine synthase, partial [Candidatus Polarisedimenticolia bacterium]|nr:fused MFS/spermidine synthase [Candidatus Polarisedimenticolia bacterium]